MPCKLDFHVVHATGEDDSHRAGCLNYHGPLAKGWQSSRFCLYPQHLVIQLAVRSRIQKIQILCHQYLIPTKIEFFVGDVVDDAPMFQEEARYARLGYVALSDNEKTGYKARELKSVHVDAVGSFLRLNIHKNHINRQNLCNQVGIVAINVIGDSVHKKVVTSEDFNFGGSTVFDQDPALEGLVNKPDYISPLDDLAFDMYQDPEIARIIRKLEAKKQRAVIEEKYDYAKHLKEATSHLQKIGEKLGKIEVEKQQAVDNEDYDAAKLMKVQMEELRQVAYSNSHVQSLIDRPDVSQDPVEATETGRPPTPPSPKLVALTDRSSPPLVYCQTPLMMHSYDERPLPVMNRPQLITDEEKIPEVIQVEPEPMSELDLRQASAAIDVFGYPLVSKAYSKTWSYREDAQLAVYRHLLDATGHDREEMRSTLRAAVFLVQRGIDDKVYAVFKASLSLLRVMLTEFVPTHKIPKVDVVHAVERTLQHLLHKAGDTAARNREDAKAFIYEMADYPDVKPTCTVAQECVKPIKLIMAPRLAQSRAEILEHLYQRDQLSDGLTLYNVMEFCTVALNHNTWEVREVTERFIGQLYLNHGAPVKNHLPPDNDKTRKKTMWRLLFEYFDKVDGKPSKAELKKQKAEEEAHKQAKINNLQRQLHELRQIPEKENAKPGKKGTESKKQSRGKGQEENLSAVHTDKVCIFCEQRNETFTEEGLDMHYWKSCPMLKRCASCKQVVEIAAYTDHMMTECDSRSDFGRCLRCTEAVSQAELDQHIADKACNPSKGGLSHCPLCHDNLPSGEAGWKQHLMSKDGCVQNPRRIPALNATAGSKVGLKPPPSKLSKPINRPTGRTDNR